MVWVFLYFIGWYILPDCDYIARIIIDDDAYVYNEIKIQCANEKGHNGGHLIVIPK